MSVRDESKKTVEKPAIKAPTKAEMEALESFGEELGMPKKKEPEKLAPAAPAKVTKTKPKTAAPVPATIDYEKLAEATARGVAKAGEDTRKAAEAAKPKPEEAAPEFSREIQRQITVLEAMEKSHPEIYRDVSKSFVNGLRAVAKYRKDWEAANPGKEYDEDADDHKEFYAKHDVQWDADDYNEALADMRATQAADRVRKEMEEKYKKDMDEALAPSRAKERESAIAPKLIEEQRRIGSIILKQIGGDYAGVFNDQNVPDVEKYNALKADDPDAAVVFNATHYAEALCLEGLKIEAGVVAYDSANPKHEAYGKFASEMEQEMSRQPADKQRRNGKMFLPSSKFWKLKLEERENYWTLSAPDINKIYAELTAKSIKKKLADDDAAFKSKARRLGLMEPEQTTKSRGEPNENMGYKPVPVQTVGGQNIGHKSASGQGGLKKAGQDFLRDWGN